MSEFGSIKNAGKPESPTNLNNESLAQFGVLQSNKAAPSNGNTGKPDVLNSGPDNGRASKMSNKHVNPSDGPP